MKKTKKTNPKKLTSNRKPQTRLRRQPLKADSLRFLPNVWAKLLYLRDYGPTEVGGFGISSSDDLLLIEDLQLVQQKCSAAFVAFDDQSVADYFDEQIDVGRQPQQFGRIWIHTHPGCCAQPSATDEATFARVFGATDWALMFILARGGENYARLRFNTGPGGDFELRTEVDFTRTFTGSDEAVWEQEYLHCVQRDAFAMNPMMPDEQTINDYEDWFDDWSEHDTFTPERSAFDDNLY